MRAQFLTGVILMIFLGGRAAHSQAAAESVLLNGNSAAATAKAGTSIGNALNTAGGSVGTRIQQTVPRRANIHGGVNIKIERSPRTVAQASPAAAPKPAATEGGMITSIQGGRLSSAKPPAAAPTPK